MNSAKSRPPVPPRPFTAPATARFTAPPQPKSRNTLWAGLGALAIALAAGAVVTATSGSDQTATVLQVVDGNSVDVTLDGETVRVRLRNVAVPSATDPDPLAQCLGPESTAFLEQTLPVGSSVRLAHGVDQDDAMLAGVYLDDTFVNEEIARVGLGVAVPDDSEIDSDDFYDAVLSAQGEAVEAGHGVYSAVIDCTIAFHLDSYENDSRTLEVATREAVRLARAAQESALESLNTVSADVDRLAGDVAALSAVVSAPEEPVFPMLAFATEPARSLVPAMTDRLTSIAPRISTAQSSIATAITTTEERIAAKLRAAEAAAAAQAERAAAAARWAAEEAAQDAADAAAERAAAAAVPRPKAPSTSGGIDTYTGCRAYGPGGTSIDNKGRRYTKISCS